MSDQLSRFRREQPVTGTSTPTKETTGKRTYEAFDKTGKPSTCIEIRCVLQPSQAPQSRFLMATVFSADYNNLFTLIYSFMAVEVRGRNLSDIRKAIQQGKCGFIQEFHPNEFAQPGANDPVIESIRFIAGDKLDDILTSHKAGQ